MAPKRNSSPPASIPIGNCEVTIEAKNFTHEADSNSLLISLSRNAKIKISVKEEGNRKCDSDTGHSNKEEKDSLFGDYSFVLVNPKDADNCQKSYLQEVLDLYMKELPAMNYAANTGKESMFLERCVLSGKYCTLLLKSKSAENSEKVIAAITYQIVPADAQFAEIPLAAVSSIYQHKGIGKFLYLELKKRLQSVGICTILCWGDKESEGFWIKQDFEAVAEVDKKGRACRLPIKTNVRKALCFPGGSTFMVSHLNKDSPARSADSVQFTVQLKAHCESTNEMISIDHSEPQGGSGEEKQHRMNSCRDLVLDQMGSSGELPSANADLAVKSCSCSNQGTKRRVWEALVSSLKSKKVKGTHTLGCHLDSFWSLGSESYKNDTCHESPMGTSKDKLLVGLAPKSPLNSTCVEKVTEDCTPAHNLPDATVGKELCSREDRFRIMLMNIADDNKKVHLTKLIEDLGGTVTSDGNVSTHVVTGKSRKTLNFCSALCSGSWIVSPCWLKESCRQGKFVDEAPYILDDKEYQLKYRAELKDAVLRARAKPGSLLTGYDVCMAAHVQPPVKTLSAIVIAAGGNVVPGLGKVNEASKTIFVASEEEMEEAVLAIEKGIPTFSSDWLMNCVMRQELDLEAPQFAESL